MGGVVLSVREFYRKEGIQLMRVIDIFLMDLYSYTLVKHQRFRLQRSRKTGKSQMCLEQ